MSDEREPLEVLEDAVRAFLATYGDEPAVMSAGVLCVELTRFTDDGRQVSSVEYVGLTDSMAASAGVVTVAQVKLLRDLGAYQDDEGEAGLD